MNVGPLKTLRIRKDNAGNDSEQDADIRLRKKRRLKYIAVLPSFITLMNGVAGFVAIIFASRSSVESWGFSFLRRSYMTSFALAGYMIFLAMIADMLDGRVARLTRTTSSFGGQLDSLSDAISFGVAPAFLMLKLVEFYLERLRAGGFAFFVIVERAVLFSAIFYAMCAVVRLARFNVENEEDESAHMNFSGLPSPAAAGVVASLVIFQQQFLLRITDDAAGALRIMEIVTVSALPLITLFAGLLMVTRVRYPHAANQLLRGKKTLSTLLALFALVLFVLRNIQLAMVVGFCGFALFGVIRWLVVKCVRKAPPRLPAAGSE